MKKVILSILAIILGANAGALRAEDIHAAAGAAAPSEEPGNIGVPAECEDVMLQAFYWDSYKTNAKYGCTKWNYLLRDTTAITENFDLVWFPPSASGGGVGYTHKCLSDQNGDWGPKLQLQNLIKALHRGGTKVLADIVINHRGNKSSWCDFYGDNFGQYGSYQLTQKHICRFDEGFTKSESSCYNASTDDRGAEDSGTNFDGARDLDHKNEYVQSWAKAYVQWMLDVMQYDGFRYDMTLGYAGSYLRMYNEASHPYLSVSEFWESIDRQVAHLKATNYNTMIFDFPLKYKLHDAICKAPYAYGGLRNPSNSLRGKGYGKYAVTFVDNHDTFERSSYGENQFNGKTQLSDSVTHRRVMQAYAYILMMPGVPCVFYPHWKSYSEEINQLIALRKRVGIHSESVVSEESGAQKKYSGKVQGHRGQVVVRLGDNRDMTVPEGFEVAIEGEGYTVYAKMGAQGIEEISHQPSAVRGEKFIRDGKLYIRCGEQVYDALGNRIRGN